MHKENGPILTQISHISGVRAYVYRSKTMEFTLIDLTLRRRDAQEAMSEKEKRPDTRSKNDNQRLSPHPCLL